MGYFLRRLAATLPVMAVVSVLVFLLIHLSPGDPAALIAGDLATGEDIEKLRIALGLNQPLWQQFAIWVGKLARGDLGTSIFTQVPVTELLGQRLEPTASIAALTMLITLVIAVPLGTLAAYRAGSWIDRLVMLFAVLAFSLPVFLIGYLLIYGFAIQLQWFPVQGYVRFAEDPGRWLQSLVLPCVNLALVYIALITRMTRATVLEVLHEDYIRTAWAKGLGVLPVLGHALRNAAIPIATTVGVGIALLIGGVVVTETVFAIPGVGRLVIDSVQRHDYPVIQSVLLLSAGVYVLINLLIDLSYRLFDPRIQYSRPCPPPCPLPEDLPGAADPVPRRWRWLRKHPTLIIGALLLIVVAVISLAAPWIATHDPQDLDPLTRMQGASAEHYFGTDALGRDVFSRAVWGGRVSLIVGISVAVLATVAGVLLGLTAGFVRWTDGPIMRVMDGLMAIPGILLAIALMAVTQASLTTVIVAITIPEIPRVARLVRSLALTLREQLFVEAAHAVGTRLPVILWRHVLPNIVAPLVVQATFVAASAVLIEAALSFLGVGVPAQTPSWGNMMAEGRNFVAVAFHIILYPGILLALTVLAINLLGDGLRDALDPRLARQL